MAINAGRLLSIQNAFVECGVGVATGTLELDHKYRRNFKWLLSDWSQVRGILQNNFEGSHPLLPIKNQ